MISRQWLNVHVAQLSEEFNVALHKMNMGSLCVLWIKIEIYQLQHENQPIWTFHRHNYTIQQVFDEMKTYLQNKVKKIIQVLYIWLYLCFLFIYRYFKFMVKL